MNIVEILWPHGLALFVNIGEEKVFFDPKKQGFQYRGFSVQAVGSLKFVSILTCKMPK